MQKAEQAWQHEPRDHKLYAVWTVRALIAYCRGDAAETLESAQKAVAFMRPDNHLERALSLMGLALGFLMNGRITEAEEQFGETLVASEKAGHLIVYFGSLGWLGLVHATQGKLQQAAKILRQALQQGSQQFPESSIFAHSMLCDLEREWNNLEAAESYRLTCMELERRTGRNWLLLVDGLKALVWMHWAHGESDQALHLIERELELARRLRNEQVIRQMGALRAQLCLWRGDLAAAARWAEASNLLNDNDFTYGREIEYLMAELLRQFIRERQKESLLESPRVLQNYVMKLLAAFPPELVPAAVQTHKTSAALPASCLVDPLSERELEVLKLIANGLSNSEIARQLFVATSMVKRHIIRQAGCPQSRFAGWRRGRN